MNVGSTADVVLIPAHMIVVEVVPEGRKLITPVTSQSPALKLTPAALNCVLLVGFPGALVKDTNSPTDPALALSAVVVPTIPRVVEGVIATF
jgi:hypothetical protein